MTSGASTVAPSVERAPAAAAQDGSSQTADALAAELHEYVDESQLYRIDHFLGKEADNLAGHGVWRGPWVTE